MAEQYNVAIFRCRARLSKFSNVHANTISFGFSVSDFIAASQLIAGIISSLKESGGSRSEYQELVRELVILDRTLKHLDTLKGPGVDSVKCAALS